MILITLRTMLALLWLAATSLSAGSFLGRLLPDSLSARERAGFCALGGLGFFSLTLFLAGQLHFGLFTVLAISAIWLLVQGAPAWRLLRAACSDNAEHVARHGRAAAAIVLFILALTFLSGLAEPVGNWEMDAVSYHLLGPKVWLRDGLIRPVADNCHTAFPATGETLFAALMAVGNDRAPDASAVLTLPLLLCVAMSLGRKLGLARSWLYWVAAVMCTMPAVYVGTHATFVDGIYAAFALAALRIALDTNDPRNWLALGIFSGLAIATKYTGLLALPIVALVALVVARHANDGRRMTRYAVGGVILACLIGAPYYLRNWIVLGCPIYPPPPGYAHFCTPKYLSPAVVQSFHDYIRERGKGLGRGPLAFLLLPFNLTYETSRFHGAGGIGLCPLALAPLALVFRRFDRSTQALGVFAFLTTAVWFVTQQESRFLISVYAVCAVLAVAAWRDLQARPRLLRWLAAAVVALSVSYGLFMTLRDRKDGLHAVVSPGFAEFRHRRDIQYADAFRFVNARTDVRKILVLDRHLAPYFLDVPYLKPVGHWGERTLPGGPSASDVLREPCAFGVTHVLDVRSDLSNFQVAEADSRFAREFTSEDARVYALHCGEN